MTAATPVLAPVAVHVPLAATGAGAAGGAIAGQKVVKAFNEAYERYEKRVDPILERVNGWLERTIG